MNERMQQLMANVSKKAQAAAEAREAHKKEILDSVQAIHGTVVAMALSSSCDLFEKMTSVLSACGKFMPKDVCEKMSEVLCIAHAEAYSTMTAIACTFMVQHELMEKHGIKLPDPDEARTEKTVKDLGLMRDRLMDRQLDFLKAMNDIAAELESQFNADKE